MAAAEKSEDFSDLIGNLDRELVMDESPSVTFHQHNHQNYLEQKTSHHGGPAQPIIYIPPKIDPDRYQVDIPDLIIPEPTGGEKFLYFLLDQAHYWGSTRAQ